MDPITAQLIVAAVPMAVELIKLAADKQPNAITPEQWATLRSLFTETYEQRTARITAELQQIGVLPNRD